MATNKPKLTKLPVQTTGQTGTDNTQAVSDYKEFLTAVAKSPALVSGWSKLLKSSGYYKGKITDKYTPALQSAFDRAEQARLSISSVRPLTRDAFIKEAIDLAAGGGGGSGSATPITKYIDVSVTPSSKAKDLINAIILDTLGRQATDAEVKKYTAALNAAEKKTPTTTKYTTSGATRTSSTTGGLDTQQYLIDQISGTDEAKANKVLGFYETFMNALGGK
jgi:hypothetical protein